MTSTLFILHFSDLFSPLNTKTEKNTHKEHLFSRLHLQKASVAHFSCVNVSVYDMSLSDFLTQLGIFPLVSLFSRLLLLDLVFHHNLIQKLVLFFVFAL